MSRKSCIPGCWWEREEKIWSLKTRKRWIGSVFQIEGGWAYSVHIGNGGARVSFTFQSMTEAMAGLEKEVGK